MKYSNPKIPEGINTTEVNSVKEFILLGSGIVAAVIMIVLLFAALLDWGSKYIPFSYEKELAAPFVDTYLNEYANEITRDNNVVDHYLQSLANKIALLMSLSDDTEITLHYINQDTVNGMATLGGHVFIFRGLLEKLPSENALVMLLAHEIAHVKLRHPVKALSKGVLISLILAVVSGQSNADVSGLVSGTSQIAFLGFSRSQEQDADNEAIMLNQRYYQHTQGAIELLEVLENESKKGSVDTIALLNSHPELGKRIAEVKKQSKLNGWQQYGELSAIPEAIVTQLAQDKLALELKADK